MDRRYTIALVDDSAATLAQGKAMLSGHYRVFTAASAAALFEALGHMTPDLILLDVMMPETDGYETIRRLKADARYSGIPVVFLTSRSDEESEMRGFALGAADYVAKPFSAPLLLKRIENHVKLARMLCEKTAEVDLLNNALIAEAAELIERRDSLTGGHISRTMRFMEILISAMQESGRYAAATAGWDAGGVAYSSQLHDIGKVAISDVILNKPGKLTDDEFELMKAHVPVGVDIIEKIMSETKGHELLRCARTITGAHHEKHNGSGYPAGASGEDIPLEGRVMAIVDVYDALISERPYKKALPHAEAVRIISEGAGKHFDPGLVDVFLKVESKLPAAAGLC